MSAANDHVEHLLDDYLHDLLQPNVIFQVAGHCDECPSCRAALEAARQRFRAIRSTAAPLPEALVQTVLQRIDAADRRRRTLQRRAIVAFASSAAAAALLLAGLQWYFQTLTTTPYDLVVLGQKTLLSAAPASLRVRLVDRVTGLALAGVPVTVELLDGSAGRVELARFDTDAAGTGRPRFRLPAWADGDYRLRVTAATPGGAEVIEEPVRLRRSWKVMLSSDKPVYQPGQTIHLRALTLRRPDLHPVAGEATTFTITDPKGNVIFKHRPPTSKYGIAAADCELASEILEGTYTVDCLVGDTASKLAVEVKRYVLPKFKVVVQTDKPYYAPGDAARVTVQADYFFGKPVADAAVEVEMAGIPSEATAVANAAAKSKVHTDAKGTATLTLVLPASPPVSDLPVTFYVAVTDTARQSQKSEVVRVVTTIPLRIEVLPESGTLVDGVPNRIYVLTTYPDGSPARAKVTVNGIPGELQTDEQGVASFEVTPPVQYARRMTLQATDAKGVTARLEQVLESDLHGLSFLLRTDRPVYDGGQTMELTALGSGSQPVFVDILRDEQTVLTETIEMKDGRGSLAVDLSPELVGTLRLSAYRIGYDGSLQNKTRAVYVRPASQLRVKAAFDHAAYRPGQRARLSMSVTDANGKPAPGALSLAAVDEAVFGLVRQAPGSERSFYTLDLELLKSARKHRALEADRRVAEESGRLQEAVFAATSQSGQNPLAMALPDGTPNPTASLYPLADYSYLVKRETIELRREHGLENVVTGWIALGLVLVGTLALAAAITLPLRVTIPSGIVGGLAVCMYAIQSLMVAGAPAPVQTDAVLIRGLPIDSIATQNRPSTDGFFTNWGTSSYAFSGQVVLGVGQNPADGGPGGRQAIPLRIRELFPETLLWRPELVTDDEGRASLDIDLADSITTWRLSASAVSADGWLGATQAPLKVFQPFFVDVNLPVALTRGDEVAVPVVVSNYLDKPQTVSLTLDDAPWCERLGAAEQRLDLQPGEVRSVSFRLRAKVAGTHTLQVSARGSGVADAVKRAVDVVPDGRRVEQVVNGTLASPADVELDVPEAIVPGSVRATVKVYPSGFSQLVEGLEGIFQMPHGCFEQTSSTTYPNLLALDYLRRTRQSRPEIEAKAQHYVHLGYQRLVGFEVAGGGFDWFGRPPANRILTAYGLLEFEDMARVHDVDPKLIERTRSWLLAQRQGDGSWAGEGHLPHDAGAAVNDARLQTLAATAYVARAVFGNGYKERRESTRDYLLGTKPDQIADPQVLALVADALLALDEPAAASLYLDRLDALKKASPDGRQVWWEQSAGQQTVFYGSGAAGSVETTARATLALLHGRVHPATSRAALQWLLARRGSAGTWPSTQATVLSLQALLAATGGGLDSHERRFEVRLGDKLVREIVVPADQAEVMQQIDLTPQLTRGRNRLTLKELTDTATGYQVAFRYHTPDSDAADNAGPLAIRVTYDRTEVAVGDTVKAAATAETRRGEPSAMVMVDLPVPAGFAAVADDFGALVQAGKVAKFQLQPRGVLVYLRELAPNKPVQFDYRLKATTPAKATAPAARVYEYYNPDRLGLGVPMTFTVRGS